MNTMTPAATPPARVEDPPRGSHILTGSDDTTGQRSGLTSMAEHGRRCTYAGPRGGIEPGEAHEKATALATGPGATSNEPPPTR